MKVHIHIAISFLLSGILAGCENNEPAGYPTEGFIETYLSMEELIVMESGNPNDYYTYFCFCNASDHLIDPAIGFESGTGVSGEIKPGYKHTRVVHHEVFEPYSSTQLISSFEPYIQIMEVFYDDYEGFRYQRPGMIWEEYTDFSQHFKSKQVRDQSQWIYEEFTPNRARWTYIFTNADYERAKKISEERDKNNPEAM